MTKKKRVVRKKSIRIGKLQQSGKGAGALPYATMNFRLPLELAKAVKVLAVEQNLTLQEIGRGLSEGFVQRKGKVK